MVVFKALTLDEFSIDLLDYFDRYEVVQKAWRSIDGEKMLFDVHYVEHWNQSDLRNRAENLRKTLTQNGSVFLAMDEEVVIGFASLEKQPFGSRFSMLQLSELHISRGNRGQGYGKQLFERCADRAKTLGAGAIYISASSCENTQKFYKQLGCIDATEVNWHLAALEPFDVQLMYVIS